MIFKSEVSLGDLIAAGSFLVTAAALFITLYQLRLDAARKRDEFRVMALMKQLDTLTRIQAMSDDRRKAAWAAIALAPGGPGPDSSIEKAIAIQVGYLDVIANSKKIPTIPTYGRGGPIY